jgi:hypothetical protein
MDIDSSLGCVTPAGKPGLADLTGRGRAVAMTKAPHAGSTIRADDQDFAFDCDAHATELPLIWERAWMSWPRG